MADEFAPRRQTVTILQACELIGVSKRTLYHWLSAGKVEYVRTAGGSVRIFLDTLYKAGNVPADVAIDSIRYVTMNPRG